MANSVNTHEMARYELYHLDLHCLQRYLFSSAGLKALHTDFDEVRYVLTNIKYCFSYILPCAVDTLKSFTGVYLG